MEGIEIKEEKKRYGHERMVVYQNIDKIDFMVQREILSKIPALMTVKAGTAEKMRKAGMARKIRWLIRPSPPSSLLAF